MSPSYGEAPRAPAVPVESTGTGLQRIATRPAEAETLIPDLLDIVFFSSRRGHTIFACDWSSDVCSSDLGAWWRLVVESLAWRPDLIHAHNTHAVTLSVWARRFLHFAGAAPRIVATRRVVFPVSPRSTLHQADIVVAVSVAVRSTLVAAGFPPGQIVVVYDGIDPDEVRRAAGPSFGIRATLGLPTGAPVVANVAALEPAKDQRTLIRAARSARADRPDLHWVVAGSEER